MIEKGDARRVPAPKEKNMHRDTLQLIDEWGPEKVVCVSDRKSGMRGVLVIDNTARGVGKGGTRMSANLSVLEVARLARTMTWKWAGVDLFHGGAKAGILGDPSTPNKEEVLRAFARALSNEVPVEYVFGLDMGLTERDTAIFVDELGDRGAAVGLPRALGGLPYDELGVTGYGVAEATDAAAAEISMPIVGATVAIQGFGAVGQAAAERLDELGAVITAVSTSAGAIIDPDGLDVKKLIELRREFGDACVNQYGGSCDPSAALETDAKILIPAAREDVIDEELAGATSAMLIVEGANMPITPAGLEVLHGRGITVVPDFVANAGGIVAAAHSMDARYSPFTVNASDVFPMISAKMRANTRTVIREAQVRNLTPHVAAQEIAQDRVRTAMRLRGQIRVDAR
jgi:glutamate dehydrogenase (NAD(P)+)